MNHCDEDSWKVREFEQLGEHIDQPHLLMPGWDESVYHPGFKEWLFRRPLLWRRFFSSAVRAMQHKDAYDFSALTFVQIVLFQSTKDDPCYLHRFDHTDYFFVPGLGYLLMAIYPKATQMLEIGEGGDAQAMRVVDIPSFIGCPTKNLPAFLGLELDALDRNSSYKLYP